MFRPLVLLALQVLAISAKTVTYNWEVDWVSVSPDGHERSAVGINGQWPCPSIAADVGDQVVVNVKNCLVNETTSIHFHGIFQHGSNQMDGPAMVTQCPIPPGETFTYDFTLKQTGTYWYHAHVGGQYLDGLRGPLIIHDPKAPFAYDEEVVLTLSDWYHTQAPYLIQYFQSSLNENLHGGSEPVPNATLINEAQNVHIPIKANKAYLFRIINMGGFAAQYFQFDQHDMTVVEIDGVYTQPHRVNQIFLTAAQRYSVIVHSKSNTKQNFAIIASMNDDMFDPGVTPNDIDQSCNAWLIYDNTKPLPPPLKPIDDDVTQQSEDDTVFVPLDNRRPFGPVAKQIPLAVNFSANAQNQNRGSFNNISYVAPQVPTLYTALSAPADLVNNPLIYGANTNPIVLKMGEIVDLLITNYDGGAHPFHLHGHQFQVIARSSAGPDDGPPLTIPTNYLSKEPAAPMRRDTVLIYGNGYAVIRFKVDNPGITLFHCHIEWHVEAGLTLVFVEAPTELQKLKLVIPQNHKDACQKLNIPMSGNAMGRQGSEKAWLDLSGEPTLPALDDWGALVQPPASNNPNVLAPRTLGRLGRFVGKESDGGE
ncbi:multicopper oxidase [Stipitochalara longipes BDJ]|nr:multicopper oxidase [Stipitochalara longipes BDJ]